MQDQKNHQNTVKIVEAWERPHDLYAFEIGGPHDPRIKRGEQIAWLIQAHIAVLSTEDVEIPNGFENVECVLGGVLYSCL